METSFFYFKSIIQYFLITSLILQSNTSFATENQLPHSPKKVITIVKVQDFKYHRIYYYNGLSIFLPKHNKALKIINFIKGDTSLQITSGKNRTTYEFNSESKKSKHTILGNLSGKHLDLAYLRRDKTTFFNTPDQCELKIDPIKRIFNEKNNLTDKIDAIDFEDIIDSASCNEISNKEKQNLTDRIKEQLTINSNNIQKCFENPDVINIINNNAALKQNVSMMFARFLNMINQDKAGYGFKIKCSDSIDASNKNATFNEQAGEMTISKSILSDSNKLKMALRHELFHANSSLITNGNANVCVNESVVKNIENLCFMSDKEIKEKTFNLENVFNSCNKASNEVFNKINASIKGEYTPPQIAQAASQIQSTATTKNLQTTINPDQLTAATPTPEQVTTLANSKLATTKGDDTMKKPGEVQTVQLTPAAQETLNKVANAGDSALTVMTSGLNKALAALNTQAQANTKNNNSGNRDSNQTDSSTQSSSGRSPASAGGITVGVGDASKMLAARYSENFNNPDQPAAATPNGSGAAIPITARADVKNPSGTKTDAGKATGSSSAAAGAMKTNPGDLKALASGGVSASAALDANNKFKSGNFLNDAVAVNDPDPTAAATGSTSGSNASAATTTTAATTSSTATPEKVNPVNSNINASAGFSAGGRQIANDNNYVQSLSNFNRVSGRTYNEIRNKYEDNNFNYLLEKRGILIQYTTNGARRSAGAKPESAREIFVDDGTALVKKTATKK